MRKHMRFRATLLAVLVLIFFFAAFKVVKGYTDAKKEQDAFDELAAIVAQNSPASAQQTGQDAPSFESTPVPTAGIQGEDPPQNKSEGDASEEAAEEADSEPVIFPQYLPLYERNPDFFGWICIENTVLDYPVMHTPDDPEKYLRLSFEGETSTAGTPFLDAKCGIDSDNYIIYGHNMKNGTMFSDVTQYRNEDYFTEHPIIEFETAQGLKLYTVFAVVYVKNNDGWYDFHTAADETDYNNKIAEIKRRALYDTGITPEYGQQLLTLSTCYGATKSDRIIVIGVESNP